MNLHSVNLQFAGVGFMDSAAAAAAAEIASWGSRDCSRAQQVASVLQMGSVPLFSTEPWLSWQRPAMMREAMPMWHQLGNTLAPMHGCAVAAQGTFACVFCVCPLLHSGHEHVVDQG